MSTQIKKLLIANRGEIACRIIHACRELDISPIAIFSEPDHKSRHVELADEKWKLDGQPGQAGKTYLDIAQIVEIAKKAGADAIHPGYGFLSENPAFAKACIDAGIIFVGPSPEIINLMGSKVESRRAMEKAKVPVVPGTTDPVTDPEIVKELGIKYGYPLAIKASAGGGGRGLRVVKNAEEVEAALAGAKREGESYFGSGEVYVEKYLDKPRHIEVQILGDKFGNLIHLYERDCSSQRRHQKLLEEAPAFKLDKKVKDKLLEAAVRGAKSIGYFSAGTMEFLAWKDQFYFLEMNTRVQVEHPITELTTGVDIVKEQILIACGERLQLKQDEVKQNGHSIECRINAEDPSRNFMPSPGTITEYVVPQRPWTRLDSGSYQGYQVLPFYDSLLAKLVVWGSNRTEAIKRMKLALAEYTIKGLSTTISFHQALLDNEEFIRGEVHTGFIEQEFMKEFKAMAKPQAPAQAPVQAVASELEKSLKPARSFNVEVDRRIFTVNVAEYVSAASESNTGKTATAVKEAPKALVSEAASPSSSSSGEVRSLMNGLVKQILVSEKDKVTVGQKLITFEAMKMETDVTADKNGTVSSIKVKTGETVNANHLLMVIE
ncbi:acetyl-CoA carboxylase biotin carboxylase subunit [bacterium]|nr:acetyl-CoA carboxylase biotin carboxylase subunit [bacterium]QQR57189.1 MAG: acetyl-CoA carboxylase biotin carboxylase subunit [Candidatus Melainabacteria bacterium]